MNILWVDLIAAFSAGFLGSIHCMAMCGPIAGYGCGMPRTNRRWFDPLLFVGGKFVSYSLLGLLAGGLGKWVSSSHWLPKTEAWLSISVGTAMAVIILYHWVVPAGKSVHWSIRIFRPLLRKIGDPESSGSRNLLPALSLGFFAALLPCGLLYAMLLRAGATGSILSGMLMMQAFGIGTSPALIGIGAISHLLPAKIQKHAVRFGEIVMLVMAASLLYRGINGLKSPKQCPLCEED